MDNILDTHALSNQHDDALRHSHRRTLNWTDGRTRPGHDRAGPRIRTGAIRVLRRRQRSIRRSPARVLPLFLERGRRSGEARPGIARTRRSPVRQRSVVSFLRWAIGVEHGWITRRQGEQRALTVLRAMVGSDDNKKFGVYIHFPDMHTGGSSHEGYEVLASTVDHALFAAGAIVAGEYFGGEVKRLADRVVADADWSALRSRTEWVRLDGVEAEGFREHARRGRVPKGALVVGERRGAVDLLPGRRVAEFRLCSGSEALLPPAQASETAPGTDCRTWCHGTAPCSRISSANAGLTTGALARTTRASLGSRRRVSTGARTRAGPS